MRIWLILGTILLGIGLTGCDNLMKAFIPEKPAAQGQAVFDGIRKGEYGPLLTSIDPGLRIKLTPNLLQSMREIFGKEPVKSVKVVGSNIRVNSNGKIYNLTYEYEMGDRWVFALIALLAQEGDKTQVEAVNVAPSARSIEAINAFTLSGKTPVHLLFLVATIAVGTFSIATAIVCWLFPVPRRKWLWRIFVLLALGSLSLNWTTGEIRYQVGNLVLLGAGFSKPFYGPVLLNIGLPVGALIFWWQRRVWLKQAREVENLDAKAL